MTGLSPDLKEKVKSRARIEDVAALRIRGMKRAGNYYKALCPFHADRNPSFHIDTRKNRYRCYACGAEGDAIQFLMEIDGLSFREAVLQLAEFCGIIETPGKPAILKRKPPPRPFDIEQEAASDLAEIEKARKLLRSSIPAHGSLAEIYLQGRGIDPAKLPAGVMVQLRFLPAVPYWHTPDNKTRPALLGEFPALIAPLQNTARAVQGVHITYLKPDGSGKIELREAGRKLPAKKMKGKPWGCAIRLGPPAPLMVFAEGIENGLSSLIAKPDWPVWVGGSLGNLAGAGQNVPGKPHPVRPGRKLPTPLPSFKRPGLLPPPECKTAILLAEQDAGDQYAVNALIERTLRRWDAMGMDARAAWSPVGKDHNDILRQAAE
ncbi:MAG: hypothetical protein DI626_01415 [Micavibrio aeruginosavorus]|uniref:Zinc finger CHC2-type domain-containing protein n=1 Tax=Micavibrio aeruginosavorus TaxID=349221 RepID=A0A2W5C3A6_9BACT|nr:MAG: hypothetical protein DI626_01415 [Micavibrio aeruginosavorus]